MNPTPPAVLAAIAEDMLAYTRALRDPYLQHNAFLSHTVLSVLAQDVDRLADRLVREAAAIAAILRDALPLIEGPLAARVSGSLPAGPRESLLCSALQAESDRLRLLLIDVHEAVESLPVPEAAALDARIWEEYRLGIERRRVEVPR